MSPVPGSVAWATSASQASAMNETYSIAPSFAEVGSMVISIMFPLVMASLRAIGAMSPEVVDVVSVPSSVRANAPPPPPPPVARPSCARWSSW